MLTACATLVSESSSLECSSMNLRAFQISTGSARFPFCNLTCLDSFVGDIFTNPQASQSWLERGRSPFLVECLSDFESAETSGLLTDAIFAKRKPSHAKRIAAQPASLRTGARETYGR